MASDFVLYSNTATVDIVAVTRGDTVHVSIMEVIGHPCDHAILRSVDTTALLSVVAKLRPSWVLLQDISLTTDDASAMLNLATIANLRTLVWYNRSLPVGDAFARALAYLVVHCKCLHHMLVDGDALDFTGLDTVLRAAEECVAERPETASGPLRKKTFVVDVAWVRAKKARVYEFRRNGVCVTTTRSYNSNPVHQPASTLDC